MAAVEQLPTMVLKPSPLKPDEVFRNDKTKDGWTLIKDTPLTSEPRLLLSGNVGSGDRRLDEMMLEERGTIIADNVGPLAGQHHAEAMLDQQDQIPVEWRSYCLIFPGTVWQDKHGDHWGAYVDWDNGDSQWVLSFNCFDWWTAYDRLVHVS